VFSPAYTALLGLNPVKSLATGVSIFESFTEGLRWTRMRLKESWK